MTDLHPVLSPPTAALDRTRNLHHYADAKVAQVPFEAIELELAAWWAR